MTLSHHVVLAVLFVLVGCCVGSFLNVCAYRIPLGLSLLWPRSRCPRCLAAVRVYDNVPVFGWLILRGRCRQCGEAISSRYPVVELVTGVSFAGVYLASVAFAPADVWEQMGALGVVVPLLLFWTLLGTTELLALLIFDSTRLVKCDQSPELRRVSEERSGVSSPDRSGGCGWVRAPRGLDAGTQPASGTARDGCAGTQPASGVDGGNSVERVREGRSAGESGRIALRGRAAAAGSGALAGNDDDVRSSRSSRRGVGRADPPDRPAWVTRSPG